MLDKKKKWSLWNIFENFEGDKVVWIIVLLLMFFSVLCMFSSTSRLLTKGETRIDVVKDQLLLVAAGIALIIIIYIIPVKWLRSLSKLGFGLSFALLLALDLKLDLGFIRSIEINGARRILKVAGIQIHVFEVAKVAMLLYLSWAMDALKKGKLKGPENPMLKKVFYIYGPFLLTFIMIAPGSNSSAIIIGGMMFITILIGGGSIKDLGALLGMGLLIVALLFGIYKVSDGQVMGRIGTGISRVFESTDWEKQAKESRVGSADWYEAIDKIRQPYSAKIAIHEGGILGKGPGQSTQRYVVPDISEDYMFSFLIEEYGLVFGGLVVILLYISLLARGSLIVRYCGNELYPKVAVASLTMLIVLQAFLHMAVNCDIGPMTGQTLPLISHGASAFLCFCVAFGVILSISRYASRKMKKEQMQAAPLVEREEVRQDLDALDAFETGEDTNDDTLIIQEYDL